MNGIHLRLFRAERLTIGTGWDAAGVRSRFWRFYANDDDGASLLLADGDFPLQAGDLYFVPALVPFSCRCTRTLGHFYAHFDVLGPPGTLGEWWARPVRVPVAATLEDAVRRLAVETSSDTGIDALRECRLKAVLYEALALCLAALPEDVRQRGEHRADEMAPILPALRYIDAHLGEPLPVARLAARCNLSADTFARLFRRCVGQSPTQYVLEQRVTQAAQRLVFSDDSIERIAEETGFGNRYYFSRLFAHRTGLSPAAYRKSGEAGT